MKSSEEMVKNLLERRDSYEAKRSKRKKVLLGISVPALCVCIGAAAFWGFHQKSGDDISLPDAGKMSLDGSASSVSAPPEEPTEEISEQDTAPLTEDAIVLPPSPIEDAPPVNTVEADDPPAVTEKGDEPPQLPGDDTNTPAPTDDESGEYTQESVITDNTGGAEVSGDVVTNETDYIWWKNKLTIGGGLPEALEKEPEAPHQIRAVYRPTTADIDDFFYEGKTLSRWAVESVEAKYMLEKMRELIKTGDELKYGPALYETGNPDGIKWDRRFYEDKVAYYGEELLGRYIVDGEFLREELERDIESYDCHEAEEMYALAFDAYMDTVLPGFIQALSASGIECKRSGNSLLMTVTADQLENIPLNDLEHWSFSVNGYVNGDVSF